MSQPEEVQDNVLDSIKQKEQNVEKRFVKLYNR